MSSATIVLINKTDTDVYFGIYNGYGKNADGEHDPVDKNSSSKPISIDANARIIGVWVNEDLFYPNNDNPFVIPYIFDGNKSYNVTLTTSNLSVDLIS